MRGLGLSAVNIAILTAAFQGLERAAVAHASIATRILQYVGGSFGTALLATLLVGQLALHASTPAGRAVAFDVTFWWSLGFTAPALIPAGLLPAVRRRREPAAAPAP